MADAKFTPPTNASTIADGPCPFCSGTYAVCRDNDTGDPFLTHTLEPCAQFVVFEPDVYLRCIRQGVN